MATLPRGWYDVVADGGAAGDGTTDDTAAIQAAIDAAEAYVAANNSSATVLFPPGVYRTSSQLTVESDSIALIGSQPGGDNFLDGLGTIIAPTEDFTDAQYVINVTSPDEERPRANFRMAGIGIAKLQADTLTNTVGGLRLKSFKAFIQDVFIDEMTGNGCLVQGDAVAGGGWNTYETKFHNVHLRRCGGVGLYLSNNTADMHFTDCVVGGNDGVGLYVTGGASCHYTSCHFTGNLHNVHMDGGGSRSKWVGCKFEAADQHNVNIDATDGGMTDLHFVGCNFNAAATLAADNTYDGFIVQRASGGNTASGVMAGCTFQQSSGTNNPRYHLNFSSAVAANWRVEGCKFDGNAQTGAFNHHANAVRCVINGLGINVGDPTSTGQWNANGQEGVMVRDTGGSTVYIYAGGAWVALN